MKEKKFYNIDTRMLLFQNTFWIIWRGVILEVNHGLRNCPERNNPERNNPERNNPEIFLGYFQDPHIA